MIVFDLDGTLADCEHRRHFVDPIKWVGKQSPFKPLPKFKPDWDAFYEACDKDSIIEPVKSILIQYCHREIEIWSGRSESVRKKTETWLDKNIFDGDFERFKNIKLKMRPIGDNTPDDELKERWLNEYYHTGHNGCLLRWATHDKCCKKVDFVFDDRPKVVRMWRRRGIFVFDCNQTGKDF